MSIPRDYRESLSHRGASPSSAQKSIRPRIHSAESADCIYLRRPMSRPEDAAREQIDAALELAGWAVQNRDAMNLDATRGVALREFPLRAGDGRACERVAGTDPEPGRRAGEGDRQPEASRSAKSSAPRRSSPGRSRLTIKRRRDCGLVCNMPGLSPFRLPLNRTGLSESV